MGFAVIDGDPQVMHGVARHHTIGQRLTHAFFNRSHEHSGNGATLDHVDKFKTGAALHRFDAQHHLAKLPRSATLLFVAAMALGALGDGFAVGDAGWTGVKLHLELLLHPGQLGAQMHIAQPTDNGFIGAGVALHLEAWVFQLKFVQYFKQAVLITLAPRLHRQSLHGQGKLEWREVNVVLIVRVVQHAVKLDLIDLGNRADVAWHQAGHFHVVLALQPVEV